MRALSALARFLGVVDEWREVRRRFGLKWTAGEYFPTIILSKDQLSTMINMYREMYEAAGREYQPYLKYVLLTGLRASEALISMKLVREREVEYVNYELMTLEHYRYPEIFIRKVKRAYVSVVDEDIIQTAREWRTRTYNALRIRLRRRGLSLKLHLGRKIHASILRREGIDSETIDLLHGRVPKSIFIRHYLVKDFREEADKVRRGLEKLRSIIGD